MNQTPFNDQPPSSLRQRPLHPLLWVLLMVAVLGALGVVGYLAFQRYQLLNAPPVVETRVAAPEAATVEPAVDVAGADAVLAAASKGLTFSPEVSAWLAQPGMVRRLVAAVWQVSEGESPREPLLFLAPSAEYAVSAREGRLFQSPESEARYDFVAKAIGTVNMTQAAALYRKSRPFAEAAFKEIAPAGADLLAALDQAIARLASVPLTDQPLEVMPLAQGVGYRFADEQLEALHRVQKHLLRMGPANARIIVRQLQAFQQATRE